VPDTGGEAEALRRAVPPAAAASTTARGILDRVRPAMIQPTRDARSWSAKTPRRTRTTPSEGT